MGSLPRPLADVARAVKEGSASGEELLRAFLSATVYSPAPPRPGVHVVKIRGRDIVSVFTSEAEPPASPTPPRPRRLWETHPDTTG